MQKRKKNSGELCRLMGKTFSRRQKWIKEDMPIVDNILTRYPALKHSKVVRAIMHACSYVHCCYIQLKQEFRTILKIEGTLTSLLDNWGIWRERIISYARVESTNRKTIVDLLEHNESPDVMEGV